MALQDIRSNRGSSAKSMAGTLKPRRGRPPKKVFINVEVRATTRDALNNIKRKAGLRSQGQVLDLLLSGKEQTS